MARDTPIWLRTFARTIYLLDGVTKIADDNADLWDGTLDAFFLLDETGAPVTTGTTYAYTGSNIDGTAATYAYVGTPYQYVHSGAGNSTNNWVAAEAPHMTTLRHLYAISDVLEVTPVPAPAPLFLFFAGLAGIGLAQRGLRG